MGDHEQELEQVHATNPFFPRLPTVGDDGSAPHASAGLEGGQLRAGLAGQQDARRGR